MYVCFPIAAFLLILNSMFKIKNKIKIKKFSF